MVSPLSRSKISLALITAALLAAAGVSQSKAATLDWRTDGNAAGTWTGANWSTTPTATGGTAWTSGSDAEFTANSTLTFATTAVGNVTVDDGVTVTVAKAATLTLGGVRTFNIGTGSTLTWTSQTQSTAIANEGAGIIKNGSGILNLGAGPGTNVRYDGGFTLNAGTVIVSGTNALSSGLATINGGTLSSSGGNTYTSSGLTIGGNFTFAGTGTDVWNAATSGISLGSTSRTITNSTTASNAIRNLAGVISGGPTVGITVNGSGLGVVQLSNAGNTFGGGVTLAGSTVSISSLANIGAGNLVFSGGILQVTGSTLTNVDARIANPTSFNGGFDVDSANPTFTVAIPLSGSGSMTKAGTGTLQLTTADPYLGNTTITKGTFQLSSTGSIPNSNTITVGITDVTPATFDVSAVPVYTVGAQTLTGDKGTVLGNTIMGPASTFLANLALFTPATPTLQFSNNLTLTPGTLINFNGIPDGTDTYTLATYAGTETGIFAGVAPAGYTIDYGTGSNSAITLIPTASPVPEPASLSLLAIGAAALLTRRRK